MKEILDKLRVDFKFYVGVKLQGLLEALGAGVASRFAEFLDKLKFIEKQITISTADKDYLYLHSGRMLPPLPPETAQGMVVFYGENGAFVKAGTELKDDNGEFVTLADGVVTETILNGVVTLADGVARMVYQSHEITNCVGTVNGVVKDITVIDADTIQFDGTGLTDGESVTVMTRHTATIPVKAKDSGIVGNRNLNDVLKTKVTIENVDKEVGVILISGGKDEESVEDYRLRIEDFMRNPQAPFNNNNIKYQNLENIKTLKYVWVESEVEGSIQVYALNTNYSLTQEEIERIIDTTKAIAPAQMDRSLITATMPTIQDVTVVIKDLSPTSDGLKEAVRKNIEYLYNTDMYEKGISRSQLEATIYKTKSGAEEVESFELVSGDTVAQEKTFYKYIDTVFQ